MWAVRAIIIALLVIAVVAFAYFNFGPSQTVDVNLIYVKYIDVPLVTVVFWSFVAGVAVSLILFISVYIRLTVQMRSAARRIQALEGEVAVLRNRPIEESADLLKGSDERKLEVKSPFAEGE
ncbi:MAG: LapA family protein [Candidatus Zixiibacteriota bacterium]|nr:MAG: LapA family protein [candidate division Zixibacteria bacterium]